MFDMNKPWDWAAQQNGMQMKKPVAPLSAQLFPTGQQEVDPQNVNLPPGLVTQAGQAAAKGVVDKGVKQIFAEEATTAGTDAAVDGAGGAFPVGAVLSATKGQYGKAAGQAAGTAIGASVGSVVPVVGTYIGGALGSWLGGAAGSYVDQGFADGTTSVPANGGIMPMVSGPLASAERRKEEAHRQKLMDNALKTSQSLYQKEEAHKAKMASMGMSSKKSPVPPMAPMQNVQVSPHGVPPVQGQLANPEAGPSDTVPAMLTPGEAVIPASAAQDPKNQPLIAQMVDEGRVGYARGKTKVGYPKKVGGKGSQNKVVSELPSVNTKGYAEGTTEVPAPTEYVVRPELLEAQRFAESRGKHRDAKGNLTTSPVGAKGISQVMPKTGVDPGYGVSPLKDESEGEYVRFQGDYMKAMLKKYDGDEEKALAAYNFGPGNLDNVIKKRGEKWKTSLPKETADYIPKILGRAVPAGGESRDDRIKRLAGEIDESKVFVPPELQGEMYSNVPMMTPQGNGPTSSLSVVQPTVSVKTVPPVKQAPAAVATSVPFVPPELQGEMYSNVPMMTPQGNGPITGLSVVQPTVSVKTVPPVKQAPAAVATPVPFVPPPESDFQTTPMDEAKAKEAERMGRMAEEAGFANQDLLQAELERVEVLQAKAQAANQPFDLKSALAKGIEKVYSSTDAGAMFNPQDLIRFSILAAGGILTGGSVSGSLRYAGAEAIKNSDARQQAIANTNAQADAESRKEVARVQAESRAEDRRVAQEIRKHTMDLTVDQQNKLVDQLKDTNVPRDVATRTMDWLKDSKDPNKVLVARKMLALSTQKDGTDAYGIDPGYDESTGKPIIRRVLKNGGVQIANPDGSSGWVSAPKGFKFMSESQRKEKDSELDKTAAAYVRNSVNKMYSNPDGSIRKGVTAAQMDQDTSYYVESFKGIRQEIGGSAVSNQDFAKMMEITLQQLGESGKRMTPEGLRQAFFGYSTLAVRPNSRQLYYHPGSGNNPASVPSPEAVTAFGSELKSKVEEWKIPLEQVVAKLETSYNGLDDKKKAQYKELAAKSKDKLSPMMVYIRENSK